MEITQLQHLPRLMPIATSEAIACSLLHLHLIYRQPMRLIEIGSAGKKDGSQDRRRLFCYQTDHPFQFLLHALQRVQPHGFISPASAAGLPTSESGPGYMGIGPHAWRA